MAVTLTEQAAEAVKKFQDAQKVDGTKVLRIGLVAGGCSGFSYSLGFDDTDKVDENADTQYEQHGVKFVVSKKSELYLDGTTVDYLNGLEKQGFTFDNPNVVKSCGCGSSFQA